MIRKELAPNLIHMAVRFCFDYMQQKTNQLEKNKGEFYDTWKYT